MKIGQPKPNDNLTRRGALGFLTGAGSWLAFGCGDSSSKRTAGADASTADASRADGTPEAGADGAACAVTPESEIGPYFADDSDPRFSRSNILPNIDGTSPQLGIPLSLSVIVLDSEQGCAPYAGAQVDVWHCNAAGVYSDQAVEGTTTETWLRGYQLTDANGKVTFATIVPGWYAGRTTHIHVRVRSSYSDASSTSDGTNTTQLFFDQTLIDRLATSVAAYDGEGQNPTTNAGDHVYAGETNGANLLSLSGTDSGGYTGTIAIVLPIAGSGGTSSGAGGP